ncbi:glycosyltransferase family 4 protein [Planctobacterium marinum]|uniref:glycosyltransferase family 4 protein n=1 Tax=Planctobacterium marinum TaxID=1631968 RepID=UPI001E47E10C|nr:glycosyltransferase family 4 protein [Planctobacterium marinum]MCC2606087.1 glycosyltransferase family 4 protein [Planctobacterium marinum]
MKKNTKQQVVILSNMYPKSHSPQYGIFVKNCVTGLRNAGFEVFLGVIAGQGRNVFEKIWKYIKYIVQGTWVVLSKPQATVYVHYVAQSAIPFLLANLLVKRKLIAHIHGGDILQEFESRFYYRVKNWLAKTLLLKADLIIVPSKYFAEVAMQVFPLDESKIFVSPSGGVNLQIFNPESKQQHQFKHDGVLKIGSVGRLDPGKGLETLLQACQQLSEQGTLYSLNIVGEGELASKLNAMVTEFGIEQRVRFSGNVPQAQLKSVYSDLDFFIFPTERDTESLGLVGLEALACGTPVIAADIAGPKGYIDDCHNGYLFSCGSVSDLAEKIQRAAGNNNEQYAELSHNAVTSSKAFDSEQVNKSLTQKIASI